jgi:hypothetical protein
MSEPMGTERLREIRERCERATKGPIVAVNRGLYRPYCNTVRPEAVDRAMLNNFRYGDWIAAYTGPNALADAEFDAHARADIPALLDEIERLRGERRGEE